MRRITAAAATVALVGGGLLATTAPASAGSAGGAAERARSYSNCTALNRDWRNGVAKNARAAQRQVREGGARPASGPRARAVYNRNYRSLDRDRDGTACEQ
ncbi:excalibur calcium-binding domain-containing protein [uncultured Nocardioides sp.]|uniref:excalibur calcium-binding domain-containing protein n=1 Tax=uncultured Nocardioides sp. TaxID=198441 RepID=UPI0034536FCF